MCSPLDNGGSNVTSKGSKFLPAYKMSHSRKQQDVTFQKATRCHIPESIKMSHSRKQQDVTFQEATRCHIPESNKMSHSRKQQDVTFQKATRCHIPESRKCHGHRSKPQIFSKYSNLSKYIKIFFPPHSKHRVYVTKTSHLTL